MLIGKPSKPNGPLDVSDVTKNGCTLTWKKPDDDGGSPIEYYEIEKLDPLTGMYIFMFIITTASRSPLLDVELFYCTAFGSIHDVHIFNQLQKRLSNSSI